MKKHAVLIGINKYKRFGQLRYARQDAEAVADALKRCYGFSDDEITLLTDADESKNMPEDRFVIEDALSPDFYANDLDLFVFGFWGHGIWENDNRYLCPMNVWDRRLTDSALPLNTVQDALGRLRVKNICLILDCCQNEVSTEGRSAAQTMTAGEETSLDLLARDIVLNLKKKTADPDYDPTVVVLNSCKKGERAFESAERRHGLFTAALLDAMEKRCDNTETLYKHVREQVPKILRTAGQHQTPYYTSEGAPSIVLPAVKKGYDVFLSYRREVGSEAALLLKTQLESRDLRVFLDVNESMAGGRFDETLLTRIEDSACFVPLLSPGCFSRPDAMSDDDWVFKEYLHAVRTHKPIVPVFASGFSWNLENLPERVEWLQKIDGVEYHSIYVEGFLNRLVNAVHNPGTLNYESILKQMTAPYRAPAGEPTVPPVQSAPQPPVPSATDEKGLVEEFERELKTMCEFLEDYTMTAPRVVRQLEVLRAICARLVKVREENLALWNCELDENRKEGMLEDLPKMVELKENIARYRMLLEYYPHQNATVDEMETFVKEQRTVVPGDVTLPYLFNSTPNQYEKFWEQKGILGYTALSPDGLYLAVSCCSEIIIVNFYTGEVLQTLEGHTSAVSSVSYSPDGRFLASGSLDNTVRIWSVQTGECVKSPLEHVDCVFSVSYSPDGRFIASGSGGKNDDNAVRIWIAQTGECVKTLRGHKNWVFSVSYSPDGRFIASGSEDKTVRIWNAQTGACVKKLKGHTYEVSSVSYSPDGRFIASGSFDNTVRIWNAQTGACVETLEGHTDFVWSVSYSPDGRFLASGSMDNTVRIWSAQTGACVKTLEGHTQDVHSVSYSPDGWLIASGSKDNSVRIWNAQTGACVKTLERHADCINSVSYSPDGQFIASGSSWYDDVHTVRIWNAQTGACVKTLEGHMSMVLSVSYSPDGRFIASGSLDKSVRIWNAQTGACVKTLGHTDKVNSVSYSPDGRFIASGGGYFDKSVRIWNVQTGECVKKLKHADCVLSVSYSPDGRFIASGGWDTTVRIWNVQTGACVKTLQGHMSMVLSVSYSPDGRFLASGSWDTTVRVWNMQTGEFWIWSALTGACVKTLEGHVNFVNSVSYSPDGRFIASGGWDSTVRIWNAQTGECVKTLERRMDDVYSVSYSPDGKYLSAGADYGLTVWRVEE